MAAFINEYEQEGIVKTSDFRGLVAEFLEFDFHHIIDGAISNYWGISRCLILSVMFWGLMSVLGAMIQNLPLFALEWMLGTAPVWLPVLLLIGAWHAWIWYVRSLYLFKRKPILLEVKFPRDLSRSPRAMENALSNLWIDSGTTTFLHRVWQGGVLPFFSLEIASFGGSVHFYIWCWDNWRPAVESALYAYYPEIEMVETEDYASKFRLDPEKQECFPTDWRYEPRNDAYPIRTYVEFELDKDPKEEYRVDPFAEVIERMSTLRPDEQMWIQIIITLCKDRRRKQGGAWWETESRYEGLLAQEINKIRKEATGGDLLEKPGEGWRRFARIGQFREAAILQAISRNMGKHPFSVGMRGVYISDADKFNAGGYTGLRWIWHSMGNPQYMNQMRPRRWGNPFDWPWQDFRDFRWRLMQRRFFDCYRRRSHFYSPWIMPHNMMSTEVIATMWHPPNGAIVAPGLERIPAKKAEPPPNLPM